MTLSSKNNPEKFDVDKERLKAILDASPDPIVIADLTGVIVDCNEAAPKTLGLSKNEIINKNVSLLLKQEDQSKVDNIIPALLERNEIMREEFTIFKKNGQKIVADASMNIVKDANGQPSNIAVIVRDITERRKAEEHIRLLSNVTEQTPEGIVVFNLEGCVIFANSAWRLMRGLSNTSALDEERIENIYVSTQIQGLLGTDIVFRGKLIMLRKDQSQLPVLTTSKLLERADGQVMGVLHIVKKFSEIAREIQDISRTASYGVPSKETED